MTYTTALKLNSGRPSILSGKYNFTVGNPNNSAAVHMGSGNAWLSSQGNDPHHHIHRPHFRMPHSLHFPHFHLHFHHHDAHGGSKKEGHDFHKDVPKGCVAVYVGSEGEQQQRFVIPVVYVNHPLFEKLLKEAEEEYGFEQKGTITIPCHVSDFQYVQGLIDEERHHSHSGGGSGGGGFCFR
jgi:SAUR family protein